MRISFNKVVKCTITGIIIVGYGAFSDSAESQEKSKVEKALSYKPVQSSVVYDIPKKSEVESCKLDRAIEKFKKPGFAVYDSSGRLLRLFFDVNRDNNLDSWSYFKDGVEVYRDIDSDFDGRADQFRWMGVAGTRYGKDKDKNGTIDSWEIISASELAEEVFHAVRTSDLARFKKLLVTSPELKSLKLGEKMEKEVATSVREASAKFNSFAKAQKAINSRSKWTQFGSARPSLIPKNSATGMQQDLVIFDHAAAVFENAGKYGQISLGTIVEISPNNWRALEIPEIVGEGQIVKNGGLFYPDPIVMGADSQVAGTAEGPEAKALVKLFEQYDAIEKKLKSASEATKVAELEKERANLFMELATKSTQKEEKQNWVRQMADTVTSAFQTESFPTGISFLESQIPKLKSLGLADQIPYVQWRMIYARFSAGHRGDRRARTKANETYNSDLAKFAKDFPTSEFAADALFQLGLTAEVTERDNVDQAVQWYTKCKKSFPKTLFGKKAAGALVRLTSQGKPLPLSGKTLNGKSFNVQSQQLRGKIVVVHYWETRCDACIEGFEELQRLGAKYKTDIQIIGANLDDDSSNTKRFLAKNRSVNWPQLHSPGGADKSPLAIQLGVATLPMTLLLDQTGKLVENNIPVDDLDREIQRLIRRASSQSNVRKSTR